MLTSQASPPRELEWDNLQGTGKEAVCRAGHSANLDVKTIRMPTHIVCVFACAHARERAHTHTRTCTQAVPWRISRDCRTAAAAGEGTAWLDGAGGRPAFHCHPFFFSDSVHVRGLPTLTGSARKVTRRAVSFAAGGAEGHSVLRACPSLASLTAARCSPGSPLEMQNLGPHLDLWSTPASRQDPGRSSSGSSAVSP